MTLIKHPNGVSYDAPEDVVQVYLDNGWSLDDGTRVNLAQCDNPDCSAKGKRVELTEDSGTCKECGQDLRVYDTGPPAEKKKLPSWLSAPTKSKSD